MTDQETQILMGYMRTELSSMKTDLTEIRETVVALRIDVAQLKIKAGLWGAAAGVVPGLVIALGAAAGMN